MAPFLGGMRGLTVFVQDVRNCANKVRDDGDDDGDDGDDDDDDDDARLAARVELVKILMMILVIIAFASAARSFARTRARERVKRDVCDAIEASRARSCSVLTVRIRFDLDA